VLTKLYYFVHTKLTPEILWISDNREHLESKLVALHYDAFYPIDVLPEVIAPELNI
jgi:hypothetical protein